MTRTYLSLILVGVGQTLSAQCDTFHHLTKGKIWEMESHSDNDKKIGKIVQEIAPMDEYGSGYEATLHQEV